MVQLNKFLSHYLRQDLIISILKKQLFYIEHIVTFHFPLEIYLKKYIFEYLTLTPRLIQPKMGTRKGLRK